MESSKIKTLAQLATIALRARKKNLKIVLAHGVFDLVHWGHIHYLREAKKHGDILIVSAVNDRFLNKSDVVKRPLLFNEKIRVAWLAELATVDFAVLSGAAGPWKIMQTIKPDYYAKGSDSKNRLKNKTSGLWRDKQEIERLGGRLVFIKSLPIHSTDILKTYES